jgi:glycosyltransferase involved in cell wall biosynthesis
MSLSLTVVIPAYNAESYLSDAILSVLHQTRRAEEIIVVDDGSTDGTSEIAKGFGNNIRYIRQDNAGVIAARNRGIAEARGDWIAFLDADDVWYPRKLEIGLPILESLPQPALLCSRSVDFKDTPPPPPPILKVCSPERVPLEQMLCGNPLGTSGVIVPRQLLLDVGRFDPRYNHAEDWVVWLKLAAKGVALYRTQQVLHAYRDGHASLGRRPFTYLRDLELRILKDFFAQHPALGSAKLQREAFAGVHLRAAFMHAQSDQFYAALGEVWLSIRVWPRRLTNYSMHTRWPRLKLCLGLLRCSSKRCVIATRRRI